MRFGVHVGIGGGFEKTIAEALAARCECIQIFAGNPRGWRATPYDESAWKNFRRLRSQHGIAPTIIHTSYLINLATDNAQLRRLSMERTAHDLSVAARAGIEYVNTHLGSYRSGERTAGVVRVCDAVATLLANAKPGPMLLLENSAGAGSLCGASIEELGAILKQVGGRRVGVCLDTAHAWASGCDISTERGVAAFLSSVDKHIGLRRVRLLHLNDTKVELGGRRDLHWHIGEGRIGRRGFGAILRSKALDHAAAICETPKSPHADRRNVMAARRLAARRTELSRKTGVKA